jgi:hypothetical protein
LSTWDMATTVGSFKTMPFFGTKTSVLAVPRSMPSLGEKMLIGKDYSTEIRGNEVVLFSFNTSPQYP